MSTHPSFTQSELAHREELLTKCFRACDFNSDGIIDANELVTVAKCFSGGQTETTSAREKSAGNSTSTIAYTNGATHSMTVNVDQEVKLILGKLDKNGDSQIDLREWVTVLNDLFRFMNAAAFEKHCEELLNLIAMYATLKLDDMKR